MTEKQFITMYQEAHNLDDIDIKLKIDLIDRYMNAERVCKHLGIPCTYLHYDSQKDKLYLRLE